MPLSVFEWSRSLLGLKILGAAASAAELIVTALPALVDLPVSAAVELRTTWLNHSGPGFRLREFHR